MAEAGSFRSTSPAATEALGAELARDLGPGDVVLVSGEVGTGKTTLIRGALRELGVRGPVASPTFTIGRRYRGSVPISHLDLYRLGELGSAGLAAEDPGLLDDYLSDETISFIEWPAAAEPELERVALRIRLGHTGGDSRVIEIDSPQRHSTS